MNEHRVACPQCKASAGFPCISNSGATMKDSVHTPRAELYRASKQLMEELA